MLINSLIKEIEETNINALELFTKKEANLHRVKQIVFDEIVNLIINDNFNYLNESANSSIPVDISITQDEENFYYSVKLPESFPKIIKLKNLVLYANIDRNEEPNRITIGINEILYERIHKLKVYVVTDIEYLQFERLKDNFISTGSAKEVNGPIYGNPSPEQIILKFFDSNEEIILEFFLHELNDFSYIVMDNSFYVSEYAITDIPYLVKKFKPVFRLSGGNSTHFIYSKTRQKRHSKENLSVKVEIEGKTAHRYGKTYIPLSYKDFPFLRSYIYDVALALLVLIAEYSLTGSTELKLLIKNLFDSTKKLVNSKNAFNFSYPSYGYYSDEYIRNGAVAWMLEALAKAVKFIPELRTTENINYIKSIANYLVSEIQANGLVRGGYGKYNPDWTFDKNYIVPWYSTEHNIDSYFALKTVYEITQEQIYLDKANQIKHSLINLIFDGEKLTQGYNDSALALDIHTWGTIFLYKAFEDKNIAISNYRYLDEYFFKRPYAYYSPGLYFPYSPEAGYPGAKKLLWFEGYFQALYTKYLILKNDIEFKNDLNFLYLYLQKNLFPYSVGMDTTYEIGEYPSLGASCWFLFFYYLYVYGIESFW